MSFFVEAVVSTACRGLKKIATLKAFGAASAEVAAATV